MSERKERRARPKADEQASAPWSAATILHANPVAPALVVRRRRRRRAAAEQAWRYRIFGEAAADSARVHMIERDEELRHADEEQAEAASVSDDSPVALPKPGPPLG
jgi:hypothetical protein